MQIQTTLKDLKKMPETKDFTEKQRRWLIKYLEYGNGTKAALETYETDSYDTASQISSQNISKLKEPVRMLLEKNGLDLNAIIRKIKQGLEADKPFGKDATIWKDYEAQHKYLETLIKLSGYKLGEPENKTLNQFNIDKVEIVNYSDRNKEKE